MKYIGESEITFGERFKEYLKAPSIYNHSYITGHYISKDSFNIVGSGIPEPHKKYKRSYIHKSE